MIPLRRSEVLRYLGFRGGSKPDEELLARIDACEEKLQEAAEPKSLYLRFPVVWGAEREHLLIAGMTIQSRDLAHNLAGCREAFLFAATLGLGADRLIKRASAVRMSDAVIYQALSAEMIEAYCNQVNEQLRQAVCREGLYLKPRFSPGYGDLPLALQKDLLQVLSAQKKIGLTLTDSLLMMPTKSVTAVIGITEETQAGHRESCKECGLTGCAYRRG